MSYKYKVLYYISMNYNWFKELQAVEQYSNQCLTSENYRSLRQGAKLRFIKHYIDLAIIYRNDYNTLTIEMENMLSAISYSEEVEDEISMVNLSSYLSEFWYIRGHLNRAEKIMIRGLAISSRLGQDFIDQRGMLFQQLATIEGDRGNHSKASKYIKDNLNAIEQSSAQSLIAESYRILGRFANNKGDYIEAQSWLEKSERIWILLKDDKGLGRTYYQIGRLAAMKQEWNNACNFYRKGIYLLKKANDRVGLGRALKDLAIIEMKLGNYQTSNNLLESSLKCREDLGHRLGLGRVFLALGDLKYAIDKIEEAETYYLKAIDIQREINDQRGIILSYWSMAKLEDKKGNTVSVLDWIKKIESMPIEVSPLSEKEVKQKYQRLKVHKNFM